MVNTGVADHLALDARFAALAHPIRRGIVERLAVNGSATVGQATRDFGVSKPAISRHLRVLEEAGLVVRAVEGRSHRISLDDDALTDAAEWITCQRARWERKFDVVEQYLAEQR